MLDIACGLRGSQPRTSVSPSAAFSAHLSRYFTDTSARWQRRDIPLDVLEGLDTGRLLVMRRGSRKVVTVASNIAVANGVCITHDGTAVLVASTSHYKVWWCWQPVSFLFVVQSHHHAGPTRRCTPTISGAPKRAP